MNAYLLFLNIIFGVFITRKSAQSPLQEEVIESLEKIDRQVSAMNSEISLAIHQSVDKIIPQISDVSDTLWLSTAQASLTKIGDTLPKFQTSSTTDQISGSLDILSAFAAVLPGAGPLVSGFFGFASGLVGIIGNGSGKQTGIGEIVSKSIDDSLSRYDDESLRSEAWGVRHEFTVSQAFLNAMVHASLSETDVFVMSSNVPVYRGARFFGVLEYKIDQTKKTTDDAQMVLSYIQMYCDLSTSRQSVLSQLQFKIQDSSFNSNIGRAIQSVINHTKLVERKVLEFLVYPNPENLVVVSTFVPSSKTIITEFLRNRDIPVRYIATNFKSLCLKSKYLTCNPTNPEKGKTLYFDERDQPEFTEFYFEHVDPTTEDNFIYIQRRRDSQQYILFDEENMTMKAGNPFERPDDYGQWKVIEMEFNDGPYLVLSPKVFPKGFVREKNEIASIYVGDPGTGGYLTVCR